MRDISDRDRSISENMKAPSAAAELDQQTCIAGRNDQTAGTPSTGTRSFPMTLFRIGASGQRPARHGQRGAIRRRG